jgi:CheY-like chemotaxis protein
VKSNVLVIENDEALADRLKNALEIEGFRVAVATSAKRSLRIARRWHPEIVVLDPSLPGMDGLDLINPLKQNPPNPHILILNARTSLPCGWEGINRGADDFVTMPFELVELIARLNAFCRRSSHNADSIVGVKAGDCNSTALTTTFCITLAQRGCSGRLMEEITRAIVGEPPYRTVKAAAVHASVSARTLDRDWRAICPAHELNECLRLALLLRIIATNGSEGERSRGAGIGVRHARKAALTLTGKSLSDLIREPGVIGIVFESWF